MVRKYFLFALMIALFPFSSAAQAQDDRLVSDFEHFYDDISIEKLSKLYWKIQKLDINNDTHVDNFLFINECDIYSDYYYNELEWGHVRDQAKAFIAENVETFPVRFKFVQPLRFGEYDPESQIFNILPQFQIKGYRKFEVLSSDWGDRICTQQGPRDIEGYPRILMVEFTQPLTLRGVPMKPRAAEKYIDEKMELFDALPEEKKSKDVVFEFREAYMVMKMKIFSYKGERNIENGYMRASVYGMLEGYEIYGDADLTNLIFFENYVRKAAEKPVNVRLQEQYEALRRKRGDEVEDEPEQENDLMNLKENTQ